MMKHTPNAPLRRGAALVWLLLSLCVAMAASSCGLVRSVRERLLPRASTPIAMLKTQPNPLRLTPLATLPPPTAIPSPLPTLKPLSTALPTPIPTASPSVASKGQPSPTPAELISISDKSNMPFTTELTEAQINDYLAGKTFDQQGLTISNVRVTLPGAEMIIVCQAKHQGSGLSMGLTARGVPVIVNGQVYAKINNVTLDQSVSGFARLIAQAAIDAALKQYSTANGIPIPTEGVTVQEVRLAAGKMTIVGRTR